MSGSAKKYSDRPAPEEVRAARIAAGLTQAQAAQLAGYGAVQRWGEIERGVEAIDPVRWRYFLHLAGLERLPWRPVKL